MHVSVILPERRVTLDDVQIDLARQPRDEPLIWRDHADSRDDENGLEFFAHTEGSTLWSRILGCRAR